MDNVDNVDKNVKNTLTSHLQRFTSVEKGKRNPQNYLYTNVHNPVDNVDNYLFVNAFPIESTFPAPIVINKSFFLHFFKINFSMSSNSLI